MWEKILPRPANSFISASVSSTRLLLQRSLSPVHMPAPDNRTSAVPGLDLSGNRAYQDLSPAGHSRTLISQSPASRTTIARVTWRSTPAYRSGSSAPQLYSV
jgi:hypothetical protein